MKRSIVFGRLMMLVAVLVTVAGLSAGVNQSPRMRGAQYQQTMDYGLTTALAGAVGITNVGRLGGQPYLNQPLSFWRDLTVRGLQEFIDACQDFLQDMGPFQDSESVVALIGLFNDLSKRALAHKADIQKDAAGSAATVWQGIMQIFTERKRLLTMLYPSLPLARALDSVPQVGTQGAGA